MIEINTKREKITKMIETNKKIPSEIIKIYIYFNSISLQGVGNCGSSQVSFSLLSVCLIISPPCKIIMAQRVTESGREWEDNSEEKEQ